MNEYPISPVYRTLGVLLAAGMIIFGFFLFSQATHAAAGRGPLLFLGVLSLLLGFWLLIGAAQLCVSVDDDVIRVRGARGLRGLRELRLEEIDGYRYGNKGRFYLVRKNGSSFFIPDYIAGRGDLIKWIKSRYENADVKERAAETNVILQDERYGTTEEDRKTRLWNTRVFTVIANVLAAVIGICLLCYPDQDSAVYLLYPLPWIGIFFTWRSKDLIRLALRNGSPHPTLIFMMIIPAVVLGIYPIMRFNFYGFATHAWLLVLLTILASIILAFIGLRATIALERQRITIFVVIVVMSVLYGAGLVDTSNCLLDKSEPQKMTATVLWKHINRGRSTSYDLGLSAWGRYRDGNTFTVSRDFFYLIQSEDTVHLLLFPGKWGIPWYGLDEAYH